MTHRVSLGSSLRFIACAGALAFSAPLAAQEPKVIVSGGGHVVFNGASPISDETIRTLIQAHAPEVLQSDSAHAVVLVVDANDQYVSCKVSKATVVAHVGDGTSIGFGESTGSGAGNIIIRRTSTSNDAGTAAPSASFFQMKTDGSDSPDGIFGSGYSMADISSIGMRRFTPGQLGTSTLIVSVVKLK
jgi:hypothetical protein